MAKELNYKQMALDIVKFVGGPENVRSLGHCMTRLRFILKDASVAQANQDTIKKIDGVVGVVYAGGQFMVILGKNLLPVFEACQKEFGFDAGSDNGGGNGAPKEKEPLTLKSAVNNVLGYVSAAVTPLVAGLIAGGMLKVVLLLITLIPGMGDFSASQTYALLNGLADAPFYFMPIFVAYGAAVKLGSTPAYSMLCAAALLHGSFTGLVAAGEPIYMFGVLPVRAVSYSTSLLPALLIALVAAHAEKLFNKIIPGIFKSILVGLCTITVTMILGYTILGPLGSYAGVAISTVFVFLGGVVAPLAVGLLAACLPWLVMCGMHAALAPFMAMAITDPGYDPVFRPAFLLHNMAEGGACIGVGIRAKDPERRSEAFGIAFGCIMAGVTEPAIYGINLPKKKPMIGVMAGGLAGGIVAGLFGARAYVMGYSTVMALPIFQDTIIGMAIGIVVTIVVAALVTAVLGYEQEEATEDTTPAIPEIAVPDDAIVAVADGKMIDIETVNDETFATKVLGEGVAFELSGDTIVAPANGNLSVLAETGHAFGVSCVNGVELLVHVGINTVEMNGVGFTNLVKAGEDVKAGQPIVKVDIELLKSKGYDVTTMLIITDDNEKEISFKPYGAVNKGDIVTL